MTTFRDIEKQFPAKGENSFKVPNGYFESLSSRVMDRIKEEEENKTTLSKEETPVRRLSLRPYLSVAATISGFALITYILLQTVISNRISDEDYFDLAMAEESGLLHDESTISDSYNSLYSESDEETEWDEAAMDYLASNEVNLELLLASN